MSQSRTLTFAEYAAGLFEENAFNFYGVKYLFKTKGLYWWNALCESTNFLDKETVASAELGAQLCSSRQKKKKKESAVKHKDAPGKK